MKSLFFISALLLATSVFPQQVPATTEQQLENLGEEKIDDDALLQQLVFFQKSPLNLNTATTEDFYLLRLLTELQVQNFLRYRAAFGGLLSIYELQAVPGFDLLTIRKLLPYVYVSDLQTMKEAFALRLKGGSHTALGRLSRTLERAKGYNQTSNTHYLGDANRLQARYNYQYKTLLYYGVVADKDAGEQFFRGAQKTGFDFYSAHFFVRNLGKIKALALGDYVVNLGQGLTQWQSLAFGKSADVLGIKRQSPVLLPYRSAGEFNFNRGAAATFQWGSWQATSFLSYKKFSGNLATDSIERFTSFGTSGYYRTASEIADRYRLSDFSGGGNLSYAKANFKIGANGVFHHFSLPLQKSSEPYNRFALAGKDLFLGSVDYSFTYKNAHFFGEAATDAQLHSALLHGALISIDPRIDLSFLYRNIQKEYNAPFGNAFTESTLPSNEEGLYSGIKLRPFSSWQLMAYADLYSFPFIKYRISSPAKGKDYLVQAVYTPGKKTEIYLRYRTETKPLNESAGVIYAPLEQTKQNLRLNFISSVNRTVSLKGRIEKVWFAKESVQENGFLSYAEVAYSPSPKWNGSLRLQYFKTDGYDTRIYAFESDVLYSFSIPAFFDKGFRYYLNLNYSPTNKLSLWLRAAQTIYSDKQAIGSGLDEIQGNHKTEVKVQAMLQF